VIYSQDTAMVDKYFILFIKCYIVVVNLIIVIILDIALLHSPSTQICNVLIHTHCRPLRQYNMIVVGTFNGLGINGISNRKISQMISSLQHDSLVT